MPAFRSQSGLTMVEMLVAMSIGLALTLVVAQLFFTSKQSFTAQDDSARMQESMRYITTNVSRTIRLAGFRFAPETVSSGTSGAFPTTARGLTGTNGSGTASDSITVRFQGSGSGSTATRAAGQLSIADAGGDGYITDCKGLKVDKHLVAESTFTIGAGSNGNNALFCNGTEIVPDVDNMQILFGEDTEASTATPSNFGANYYVNAGSVTDWDNVVSVRFAFLMRTPNNVAAQQQSKTYNLLGTTLSYNDRVIRKVITFTVNLRNRPIREPGPAS